MNLRCVSVSFPFLPILVSLFGFTFPVLGQLQDKLFITEVMWDSVHSGTDDFDKGGLANGDWFELFNASDEPIDMTGFLWDDNDRLLGDDFTIFPEFVIQPKELVILVDESEENVDAEDGFRVAWQLPENMRILNKTLFEDTGSGDTFSGLSSGGDEVNLYDDLGNLIHSIELDESAEGFSTTWGFVDGNFTDLELANEGQNGAVQAFSDGSENRLANPQFWEEDLAAGLISLDVSSAGHVEGVEVVFPGSTTDLDILCAEVAANDRTLESFHAALAAAQVLPGDANMDGAVEFSDFLVLSTNFSTDGSFSSGDFNCDGQITFADFLILSTNFGQSVGGAVAVPEPHFAGLFALAVLLLAWRRR